MRKDGPPARPHMTTSTSSSMKDAIEHAHRLCYSGKFDEALAQFKSLESDSVDAADKAGFLLDQATCYSELGRMEEARACVARAKLLVIADLEASAQIDLFAAKLFIKEGNREAAIQALSCLLGTYADWLSTKQGESLYQEIQTERAFTLMHMLRYEKARPILERVVKFPLDKEIEACARCHLGRCYFELKEDSLAKEQFLEANRIGVPEDWEANFHFHFGYTLYNLRSFKEAKREFVLCLQSGPPGPPTSLKYQMLAATSRKLGEFAQARLFDKMAES